MTVRGRKWVSITIGLAVSVLLVWALIRNIDFVQLWDALKSANYLWLIPNIAFVVLTMYQRAYRWRTMVAPIGHVPFSKLMAATCIGFMANNVLPLRLGEFVRAYSLSLQYPRITKSASLATIFVERMVFDLVALLLIFFSVLYVSHLELDDEMKAGLSIAIAAALAGIVFIMLMALKGEAAGRILARYLFFLPEAGKEFVRNVVEKFSRGLEFLTDIRSVVWVSFQTVMVWVLLGLSNLFVFKAFGLDLPLDASFVVLVVVSIAILVPSSPGFIGVYHAGAVWAMMAYGYTKSEVLPCAIVLHAAQYIVVTLMGFYYLRKEHLSFRRIQAAAEEDDSTDTPTGGKTGG
jgi:uncharacterized protein (TIRG00374 family)